MAACACDATGLPPVGAALAVAAFCFLGWVVGTLTLVPLSLVGKKWPRLGAALGITIGCGAIAAGALSVDHYGLFAAVFAIGFGAAVLLCTLLPICDVEGYDV